MPTSGAPKELKKEGKCPAQQPKRNHWKDDDAARISHIWNINLEVPFLYLPYWQGKRCNSCPEPEVHVQTTVTGTHSLPMWKLRWTACLRACVSREMFGCASVSEEEPDNWYDSVWRDTSWLGIQKMQVFFITTVFTVELFGGRKGGNFCAKENLNVLFCKPFAVRILGRVGR